MTLRMLAVAFLLAQAVGGLALWAMLFLWPETRVHFRAVDAPDSTLLAFATADIGLYALLSGIAACGLIREERWGWPALCVHAGAAAYAGLYCWGLVAATGGDGLLGAVMMTPSLIVPGVLVWLLRPRETLGLDGWRFAGPLTTWAGVALFVAGGSLGITSGVTMALHGRGTPLPADCPSELVVAGPYRRVRNPMAIAGIAQGAAVGLFLGSPAVIAHALVGAPTWHVFVRPWEEADLEKRLGEPYREYRQHVRCWWPQVHPYEPPDVAEHLPDSDNE